MVSPITFRPRNASFFAKHSLACCSFQLQQSYSRQLHRAKDYCFWQRDPCRHTKSRIFTTSAAGSSTSTKVSDLVETGLQQFKKKQYEEALKNFQKALESQPKPEEAQAALYNSACCQVKLKQWQEATDSVSEAVNKYQLPLKTAMEVNKPAGLVSPYACRPTLLGG